MWTETHAAAFALGPLPSQRSNRRSRNPEPEAVFQDCITKWEESVAHSILARSTLTPLKAVYICANQPCLSHFSLAFRRRTIHSGYAVMQARYRNRQQAAGRESAECIDRRSDELSWDQAFLLVVLAARGSPRLAASLT